MQTTARLFNCAGCRRQCLICSACDRGQRYCAPACAQAARAASQRSAGSRYQRSRTGRFRHAARQRRYRARLQKVTHQGSAATPAEVSSAASVPATALADPLTRKPPALAIAAAVRCHFCGEACSPFVRRRWLRRGAGTFRSIEPIRRTPPRPPPGHLGALIQWPRACLEISQTIFSATG